MKKIYKWNDFIVKPKIIFVIMWLISYMILFGTLKGYEFGFVCLSFLLFGWMVGFAEFEVKE